MADQNTESVECGVCGFQVGVDANGVIQKHLAGGATEPCPGSGKKPGEEVAKKGDNDKGKIAKHK